MPGPPLARELARLDALLHRAILRLRASYELSLDEFRGLYVSDEQVDALIRDRGGPADDPPPLEAPEPEPGTPWARLVATFGLAPIERDLLLLALVPELDRKYEILIAYINNDIVRKWPTADLAARVLGETPACRAALLPENRLLASGLIERLPVPAERRPERLRELAASPIVARFVEGLPLPLPAPARRLAALPGGDPGPLGRLPHDARAVWLLEGEPSGDCTTAARALGDVLAIDAPEVPVEAWQELARAVALLARLEPAIILVDATGLEGGAPPGLAEALLGWSATAPLPVGLVRPPHDPLPDGLAELPLLRVPFAEPEAPARRRLWEAAAAAQNLAVEPETLDALAARFRLSAGRIERAARSAALLRDGGAAQASLLFRGAREQSGMALGRLATRVRPRAGWDDLVLPASTLARLREVAGAIAHRDLVQHGWGMARLSAAPEGLAVLFQGPPGTGKTMAASVIADGLGLDLYRVDLATVVSKYIGETEKNLDRIFRAARGSNAVLLFDEADALFGRRSEVKDAHDRYANLEVAYLLQRMEEHDGPVILATNLPKNLDQAFTRRLHYVIEFPRPDAGARERLWRAMLAPPLPTAREVDHAVLARGFELTGGEIRKAALEAAFTAAGNGGIVDMEALLGALHRELARQGRMAAATAHRRPAPPRVGG
jgi:hypothetical protein